MVLIVEDDLLIRIHAAQIIEEAEFDVVEASNADEAIAILEARAGHRRSVHGHSNAGQHGWPKTCGCGQRTLAPDQDPHNFPASSPSSQTSCLKAADFSPKPYSPTQLAATLRELAGQ